MTRTERVVVRNDPRSTATPAALAEQLAFQRRIVGAMRSAWDGEEQVRTVRAAVAAAMQAGGGSPDARSAMERLRAVIDSAAGGESGTGEPPARAAGPTFRSANGALAGLLNAQDNADWAPTASMRAALAARCGDLAKAHDAWRRVLTASMLAANAALRAAGVPPIAAPEALAAPRCR